MLTVNATFKLARLSVQILVGISMLVSQFIEEDGHLTDVEENIMFALVSYITSEVLSDAAVPVWSVFVIKELFDELANVLLSLLLVHSLVNKTLDIVLHVWIHFTDNPLNATL